MCLLALEAGGVGLLFYEESARNRGFVKEEYSHRHPAPAASARRSLLCFLTRCLVHFLHQEKEIPREKGVQGGTCYARHVVCDDFCLKGIAVNALCPHGIKNI